MPAKVRATNEATTKHRSSFTGVGSSWQFCMLVFSLLTLLHLYVSPYTKVEESFNIQAIHDILEYGVPFSNNVNSKFKLFFDHMTFPGAVPRTFIGALLVAGISNPIVWFTNSGIFKQCICRAIIGLANALALVQYARRISQAYGNSTALVYTIFQASQFHVWYYASRTLPNMFAFCLSTTHNRTFSLSLFLPVPVPAYTQVKHTRLAVYLLTIAAVIFRSELALLLVSQALYILLKAPNFESRIAVIRSVFIPSFIPGFVVSLLLTVVIDSYFWQSSRYIWPEFFAFISNVFPSDGSQGASDWGTSPWYWYALVALPKLLTIQYPLLLLALVLSIKSDRIREIILPSLLYVVLYSLLPHKEVRFLFPIIPTISLAAAQATAQIDVWAQKNKLYTVIARFTMISTIAWAAISHGVLLPLSARNYPGGEAMTMLHRYHAHTYSASSHPSAQAAHYLNAPQIQVHITNLALQSGVTRFLEQPEEALSQATVKSTDVLNNSPKQYEMIKGQVVEIPSNNYYAQTRQSGLKDNTFEPLVIQAAPGQEPLTVYPQRPASPTGKPKAADNHISRSSKWVYDKSNTPSTELDIFYRSFDYAILEPFQLCALAATNISFTIPISIHALGNLKIYRPTTPQDPAEDISLLHAMYPSLIADTIHQVIHNVKSVLSHTPLKGCWVELTYPTKLVVVDFNSLPHDQNNQVGQHTQQILRKMCFDQQSNKHDLADTLHQAVPSILLDEVNPDTDQTLLLDAQSEAEAAEMTDIGPLVVNRDGSLSRLSNWKDMNEQERRKTLKHLRKRNGLRLENV